MTACQPGLGQEQSPEQGQGVGGAHRGRGGVRVASTNRSRCEGKSCRYCHCWRCAGRRPTVCDTRKGPTNDMGSGQVTFRVPPQFVKC